MFLWFFIKFFKVYLFLRERQRQRQRQRQSVSEGGAEIESETQDLKQAPGSKLSAQSPVWGSNPRTVRS